MAESRLTTIVDNLSDDSWNRILGGVLNNTAQTRTNFRNADGNVVVGTNSGGSFGLVVFLGYQDSIKRPGGATLTPANTDRFVYARQAEGERFNRGWDIFALPGSSPRTDTRNSPRGDTNINRAFWHFGGGGRRIGVFSQVRTNNPKGASVNSYVWDNNARAFSAGESFIAEENDIYNLPRDNIPYGVFPVRNRTASAEQVFVYFTGDRWDSLSRVSTNPGVEMLSSGDGNTIPAARTGFPVILDFDRQTNKLRALTGNPRTDVRQRLSRNSQFINTANTDIDTTGWARNLTRYSRLYDVVADGSLIWFVYPEDSRTSNTLRIVNAPQLTNPGVLTLESTTRISQPPNFPLPALTSANILNVWLAESLVDTGRRLMIVVEFAKNSAYSSFSGVSLEAPIFYITGDYLDARTINWDDAWQLVIPSGEQRRYAARRPTNIDGTGADDGNPNASIVHGVAKHNIQGKHDIALLRVVDKSVTLARIAEFRVAPLQPVMLPPTQESPAIVTQTTARSYTANGSFPLTLNWTFRSGTGGEQYAYRLQRTFNKSGQIEYWNGSSWTEILDSSSIILLPSENGRANVTIPGSGTSGWARRLDGRLFDDSLAFAVRTYDEADGIPSPLSEPLVITPAESRDPYIILPNNAYNEVNLVGSFNSQLVAQRMALRLPEDLILDRSIENFEIGLTKFENENDFFNGSLIRTLEEIRNCRIRVRGTLDGPYRITLNVSGTRPTGTRQGSVANFVASGSENKFAIDYNAGTLRDNSYIWMTHERNGDVNVTIESISITGETGQDSVQVESVVPVVWAFTGIDETAQSSVHIDLFEGKVTDFESREPVVSLTRNQPLLRQALVSVYREGTYTIRLYTVGQTRVQGVTGLRSRDSYYVFESDLVDPLQPSSQSVELITRRKRLDEVTTTRDLSKAGIKSRNGNALLYNVEFPTSRVPETPGLASVFGQERERTITANWVSPWPNNSQIVEWQFQLNNSVQLISRDADEFVDRSCGNVTFRNVFPETGTFQVRARVRNAAGWSSWSSNQNVVVSDPSGLTLPIAPVAASSPRLEIRRNRRLYILMCDPIFQGQRAIFAREFRFRVGTNSWQTREFSSGERSAVVSGIASTGSYQVQVRTRNEVGWSDWSPTSSVDASSTVYVGAVPQRALVYRRPVGSSGEGIPVGDIEIDTSEVTPKFSFVDWTPDVSVNMEYRSQFFVPDRVGSTDLVESSGDWISE